MPTVSTPKKDRELVDHLSDLMGLRLREQKNVYSLAVEASESAAERAEWMTANGIDLQQLIKDASPNAAVPLTLQDTDLPLPLPEFWQKEIFDAKHLPILDITGDRQSSLLYIGLLALDDETLEFLASHVALVKHLREDHPGPFAAFGRSLRIHGGVVDVPGGAGAAATGKSWSAARRATPSASSATFWEKTMAGSRISTTWSITSTTATARS